MTDVEATSLVYDLLAGRADQADLDILRPSSDTSFLFVWEGEVFTFGVMSTKEQMLLEALRTQSNPDDTADAWLAALKARR